MTQALRSARTEVPVQNLGVPVRFFEHAPRSRVLQDAGPDAENLTWQVTDLIGRLPAAWEDMVRVGAAGDGT
jgi:deoxyxylulose-5-phosphate synthase